ncbi:GOLPH3/VPS74 family protein [Glycomyces xiaoerkulensis]|uniref:GOLPH3/VPS74 family protein n=1 Tax=Glycomyces xiaoerkulensis TaxID=2038139 RepID=UPI000C2677A7|nr:GPP34 family phosphoprotein [Glycomyces xiaoerkulensis]
MASLLDEVLLLAYDDSSGFNKSSQLEIGLGGATILELALAGRIDVIEGKVRVVQPAPTGDPLLDQALHKLAADGPRKPQAAVQRAAKGKRRAVLDRLVARGLLVHRGEKALGFIPFHRHLPGDSAVEDDARNRLAATADAEGTDDARTAALASLVYALNLEKAALPGRDHRRARKVFKAISEGMWGGHATRKAVEGAQAAVMASIAATVAVSAAGAGGAGG